MIWVLPLGQEVHATGMPDVQAQGLMVFGGPPLK